MSFRVHGLTETYRKALRYIGRADLAEQISEVMVNWGECPRHGTFSDGLIVRRYGDSGDPEPVDWNDPDAPAHGQALSMIYPTIRQMLGEPPLSTVTVHEAKHKHCLN